MHKDISGPPLSVRERMATRLHRFRRDDAGTITVLAMIIFVGIIAICGFGVDLMMNEMKRAKLQATLDRAVLAAASLGRIEHQPDRHHGHAMRHQRFDDLAVGAGGALRHAHHARL